MFYYYGCIQERMIEDDLDHPVLLYFKFPDSTAHFASDNMRATYM